VFRLAGAEAKPATGEMPPADPPGTWGKTVDGLRTRVSVEKPKVSQWEPAVVKVEIGNVGKWPESYDPQGLRWDVRAVRPDGKPVRNVAEPYQTAGAANAIAPGGTLTLSLDLAEEHDLTLPGAYRVRFEPQGELPPSNVAALEVLPHDPAKPLPSVGVALPPGLVEAVESVLPKDWAFMGTSAPARGKGFDQPRTVWIAYLKRVSTALAIEIGQEAMRYDLLLYDRRYRGEDPLKDKGLRLLGETDWYRVYARGKPDPRLGWKDPDGDLLRALRLKGAAPVGDRGGAAPPGEKGAVAPAWEAELRKKLATPISAALEQMPLAEAAEKLGRVLDCPVRLDASAPKERRVWLMASKLPASTALRLFSSRRPL
jgi:hypothetical protein